MKRCKKCGYSIACCMCHRGSESDVNALVIWFRRLFCLHVDFVESGILDQTGLRLGLTCYTCVDCGKKKFFKEPPINMTI